MKKNEITVTDVARQTMTVLQGRFDGYRAQILNDQPPSKFRDGYLQALQDVCAILEHAKTEQHP